MFAGKKFARVIFDDSLPPLDMDAVDAVVTATHGVALPTRDELGKEHLFNQMRIEKVFGRAVYALIASSAKKFCFSRRWQLGVFAVDETHHITGSPEGEAELMDVIRYGRKDLAALLLGSHDPLADFGNETLRGLIPTRIAMRHRDRTLAKKSLQWIDLDPDDEDLVKELTENTSPVTLLEDGTEGVDPARRGEGILRDARGRIGQVQILPPAVAERFEAAKTTPGGQEPADRPDLQIVED